MLYKLVRGKHFTVASHGNVAVVAVVAVVAEAIV